MSIADDELAASRRPLKVRQTRWATAIAKRLAGAGVAPNHISLASIAFATLAAAAFVGTRYANAPIVDAVLFLLAIVGIQGRLLCNLFDGMIAVEGGHRTPTGELYNETPDRVADTLILVAAGYAADPVYGPTLGWLAALLAMATAYVRVLGKACGAGTYFVGPMAKQHRMAVITWVAFIAFLIRIFDDGVMPALDRRQLSAGLALVSLGCVPTLWRRLSRIARDLNAKGVA